MLCPPSLDPAVHLPPGIFHARHIAGDQSLRKKCCTSPPLYVTIPEVAKKGWTPDKWAEQNTDHLSVHCVIPVRPRVYTSIHPSTHPAPFHRSGIPFLPRKVTHHPLCKVSVWKERNRNVTLKWWDSCGSRLTPGDASQLKNSHRQVASLRSRLLPVNARDQRQA